jgi:cytochrome c553
MELASACQSNREVDMRIITATFALIALAGWTAQAGAQDVGRGEEKASDCVACHGALGISPNPLFPNLAGQNAAYLQMQLEKFKKGERYHPLMTPIAESLSQQEINDLAVYFSSIAPLVGAR